jgi:hypothetical protein
VFNVGFFESALINSKRHFADHVVTVVAQKISRNDGVDAIQEAANRKAQGSGQRRQFRRLAEQMGVSPLVAREALDYFTYDISHEGHELH